ncbi:MAG: winged helix-turn-helix transcriptional regulator, partial [Spirochaeta sp.]|nr:winged helix-turn-helix transcriptional regulator [Spirochaeta sp.]
FAFSREYLAGLGETTQETRQETGETTRQQTSQETRQETEERPLSTSAQEILRLIRENPDITARELTEETSLTFKGVQWNLAQLKEAGVLRRVGPKKSGHWEIIDEETP